MPYARFEPDILVFARLKAAQSQIVALFIAFISVVNNQS